MSDSFHENLAHKEVLTGPSNRSFGLTVGGILTAICLLKYWVSGELSTLWQLVLGAGLLLVAFAIVIPRLLTLANRLWMKLGALLAAVFNPIVLFVMFAVFFVPIGLFFRVIGRDALRIRKPSQARSYWVVRDPSGPAPDSATNQF